MCHTPTNADILFVESIRVAMLREPYATQCAIPGKVSLFAIIVDPRPSIFCRTAVGIKNATSMSCHSAIIQIKAAPALDSSLRTNLEVLCLLSSKHEHVSIDRAIVSEDLVRCPSTSPG
mmetsp:Transcript_6961/g.20878  ORF Transcript_6961/g.20878 Transcript_6961/m.20878 type:complete len:119 (+) Transcript_6961:578-934(+)